MNCEQWALDVAETIKSDPPANPADVVGDLQRAERVLRDVRLMLLSEVSEPQAGDDWRIVQARSAKRSYNTSGLLAAFGGFAALPGLVAEDVVRVSWNWSKLRQAATREDIPLVVVGHEIGDGDDALVGENWTSQWRVEAK